MQQPTSPVRGGMELMPRGQGARQEQQDAGQGRQARHNHHDNGEEERHAAQDQQGEHPNPRLLKEGSTSSSSSGGGSGQQKGVPAQLEGRHHKRQRLQRFLLGCGLASLFLGLACLTVTVLTVTVFPTLRDRQFLSAVVVTSPMHKEFGGWVSSNSSRTPVYTEYSFFSIQNPQDVLQGALPLYTEMGPYVFSQRTRKASVTFSDDGATVSYVTLTANDYRAELSKPLKSLDDDMVTLVNLPYVTAVATAGSERDLLRVGTATGMKELRHRFFTEFLPTLRENAVVVAIRKAVDLMDDGLKQIYYPENGVPLRWGGGCVRLAGRINHCGFGSMAVVAQLLPRQWAQDVELFSLCMETGLDSRHALPLATVKALWDVKDPLGLFNLERNSTTDRYGVSYWLSGDDAVRQRIITHFEITDYQFDKLRAYVRRIYDSGLLEKFVLRYFVDQLQANEQRKVAAQMTSWDSLVWRQWAVGDVIQMLNGYPAPESVNPPEPPELAWFMDSIGLNISNFNTSAALRWTNAQAECFFNATTLNATYYQSELLGLPPPRSRRTPFNQPHLREKPLPQTLADCLPRAYADPATGEVVETLSIVRRYIDYVADTFVRPVFETDVINADGGLFVTRSVASWLYGRQEPILKLGLDEDDPRAALFSFLGPREQDGLQESGEGDSLRCTTSADLENSYNACKLVLEHVEPDKAAPPPATPATGAAAPPLPVGNKAAASAVERAADRADRQAARVGLRVGEVGSNGDISLAAAADEAVAANASTKSEPRRHYVKVANSYYTGAGGHADRIGGLHLWHGDSVAWGLWPNGDIPITGGAMQAGSKVQYAFSEGTQFPPLNAISPSSAPFLLVFLSKFALPLRFLFARHVSVQGISLLRYKLDPLTFSPSRPDAHTYSMDVPPLRPGLFNLTDSSVAPTYLSLYRYAGTATNARLAGLADAAEGVEGDRAGVDKAGQSAIKPPSPAVEAKLNLTSQAGGAGLRSGNASAPPEKAEPQAEGDREEEWESFLDVEPYTGRTMNVRIRMMVSVSLDAKKYGVWHDQLPDLPLVPVMAMTQRASVGPEDADMFKQLVYGSAKLLDMLMYASLVVGLALVVLGAVLLVVYHGRKKGDKGDKSLEMVTVHSPMSVRV